MRGAAARRCARAAEQAGQLTLLPSPPQTTRPHTRDAAAANGRPRQIVKKKVLGGEDGKGRFKSTSDKPLRIVDREKKAALKT